MLKDQHTEMSDESSPEESWKFYVLNGLEPWTSGIVVLIFFLSSHQGTEQTQVQFRIPNCK